MSLTHCRFYEAKYPEVDELVMVNVKQIAEMGAYVKLLEYDDIDGMILLSELSRRRIRSSKGEAGRPLPQHGHRLHPCHHHKHHAHHSTTRPEPPSYRRQNQSGNAVPAAHGGQPRQDGLESATGIPYALGSL